MAHIAEKFAAFVGDRGREAAEQVKGKRIISVRITNALKDSPLELQGQPIISNGRCTHSFSVLAPGDADSIRVECDGEQGGAFEFKLGEEQLLLGMYMRASYSSFFANDQFVLEIPATQKKLWDDFYKSMPQKFMGLEGRGEKSCAGNAFVASVRKVASNAIKGYRIDIEVLLCTPSSLNILDDVDGLDTAQRHVLGDLCQDVGTDAFGSAIFLSEFEDINKGLSRISREEQAYALDMLVEFFVISGALTVSGVNVERALSKWRKSRETIGGNSGANQPALTEYRSYMDMLARGNKSELEHHVEHSHSLLRCVALGCSEKLMDKVGSLKAAGRWPPARGDEGDTRPVPLHRRSSEGYFTNDDILAHHLETSDAADQSRASFCSGMPPEDKDAFLKALVRRCIQTSAKAALRRTEMLEKFRSMQRSNEAKAQINHLSERLPVSRQQFSLPAAGDDLPEARFESFSSALFQHLDKTTSAQRVLTSLGNESQEYKKLSTNSKSGEFFFLSHDKRYLIKTISADEGHLLYSMLPAYQEHIRFNPRSLIVRFAMLCKVELPGGETKFFVVMSSVFDPAYEIHANYDVKGSLYNRKKKEGESTGKDEDWISDRMRLLLPPQIRQEILASHELDVGLLRRFGVMDYSILVGVHHLDKAAAAGSGWREEGVGIWADGARDLYFVGLIDFLIAFGVKKQAENLIRVAQGHGHDTSCVDPASYAARQVKFVRTSVVQEVRDMEDVGTTGRLKVHAISAHDLVNADGPIAAINASDPYLQVNLGLQTTKTHTIQDNLNPEWNCHLFLPVNDSHLAEDVVLSVYDQDYHRSVQGSDDFLGAITVPMERLVKEGQVALSNSKLQRISKGTLTATLTFERKAEIVFKPPPRGGKAIWEFSVRDGFQPFDDTCQDVLESKYQEFVHCNGPSTTTVASKGHNIVVDFAAWEQHVEGSARKRTVRRQ